MFVLMKKTMQALCDWVIGPHVRLSCAETAKLQAMQTQRDRLLWLADMHGDHALPHPSPRTPVLMLMRSCASYVRNTFPAIVGAVNRAARDGQVRLPRFYIYENNSSDATARKLATLSSDQIIVCSDSNGFPRPLGGARSSSRCGPMADMRNALRALALRDLVACNFCILLDVDVSFTPETLVRLLVTVKEGRLDVATPLTLVNKCHYFDTYALVHVQETPEHVLHRRDCFVDGCSQCKTWLAARKDLVARVPGMVENNILPVRSAFGGLAVVRAQTLRGSQRVWSSENDLCEHVSLCTGRRTGIVLSAKARWEQAGG